MRLSRPPNDGLNKLLRLSNRALAGFGQPPLYDETPTKRGVSSNDRRQTNRRVSPKAASSIEPVTDCSDHFHISIAWRLTEPTADAKGNASMMDLKEIAGLRVNFSNVKLKMGNIVHSIPLSNGNLDDRGFSGL